MLEHFWNTSKDYLPDLDRPTNIGYLVGTNITRAIVFKAYRPKFFGSESSRILNTKSTP